MSVLGRLQGIVQLIENPCNEPWTLYVKAALPWAGKVALSFLVIDPAQIARSMLRPKNSQRTSRHMRGGRPNAKGKRKIPAFPDLWDIVGKSQNVRGPAVQAAVQGVESAMWVVEDTIERGLWEWMIIDQASEFVYHSIADAHKSEFCRHWWDGDAYRNGLIQLFGVLGWQTANIPNLRYVNLPLECGVATMHSGDHGTIHAQFAVSMIMPPIGGPFFFGARLVGWEGDEEFIIAESTPQPYGPLGSASACLNGSVNSPGRITAWVFFTGAGGWPAEANFMGQISTVPQDPPKPKKHFHARGHVKKPKRKPTSGYDLDNGDHVSQGYNSQHIRPPTTSDYTGPMRWNAKTQRMEHWSHTEKKYVE